MNEMDKLQKLLGFSGRSEIVRAGIRGILSQERSRQDLAGFIHAILLVVHNEASDDEIGNIRHAYDELIATQLHSKIDRDRCLDIFLLRGDAKPMRDMTKKFQSNKKMDNVQLMVM